MKKRINLEELLGKPTKFYEKFHDATKIKKFPPEISPSLWPAEWKKIDYKGYPRLEEVKLPKPSLSSKTSFSEVLKKRSSKRDFANNPLTRQEISSLLYFCCGERLEDNIGRRFYPSAGAMYPIEVYLLLRKSEIGQGLYHYYVRSNTLERIGEINSRMLAFTNQEWIKKAQCIVILTAVFNRNTKKYGDRGYRHVMMEAGGLIQNFYLVSSALNLACCASGGYIDDKINKALGIDGVKEAVVAVLAIGK